MRVMAVLGQTFRRSWRSRWDLHPHSSRRQRVAFLFSYGSPLSLEFRRRSVEWNEHSALRAKAGGGGGSCTHESCAYEARLNLILPAVNRRKLVGSAGNAPVRRF